MSWAAFSGKIRQLYRRVARVSWSTARVGPEGEGFSRAVRPEARSQMGREQLQFFPRLARIEDHPTAWRFPSYLDASQPWVAMLRDLYASPLAFPASISPEMGLFLHGLVRNVRPRTVVEVGTFLGASTIWMASALAEGESDPPQSPLAVGQRRGVIHCFDDFGPITAGPWRTAELTDRPRIEVVREHLVRARVADRVVLHQGDSSVHIARLAAELRSGLQAGLSAGDAERPAANRGVDLAFIDGDHTVAGVLKDFGAVEPILNTGGYVVLHDIYPDQCGEDGPRHLLDTLHSTTAGWYEACEVYTSPLNYGMAVLRRVA